MPIPMTTQLIKLSRMPGIHWVQIQIMVFSVKISSKLSTKLTLLSKMASLVQKDRRIYQIELRGIQQNPSQEIPATAISIF